MCPDNALSADLMRSILREQLKKDSFQILQSDCKCINAKGQNFLSDLFEVTLRYSQDRSADESELRFLAKLEPSEGETAKEFVQRRNVFQRELRVLRVVVPALQAIVDKQFAPRLVYGCERRKVIAMENLRLRDFVMKDRVQGLPMAHCLMVLEHLAKFHAASVKLAEKEPALMKPYDVGVMTEDSPANFLKMVEVGLPKLAETIEGKVPAGIVEKIRKLSDSLMDRLFRVCDPQPGEFCVLNHGDAWINNILFKEDQEGKPTDVIMVDYQITVYTSPALDLINFLNLCPEWSFKYKKDDYLIDHYLDILSSTMKSVDCETRPPTLAELQESIHNRRIYAVLTGLIFYPKMLARQEEITGDYLTPCNAEQIEVLNIPRISEVMQKIVPIFDERGYLDY